MENKPKESAPKFSWLDLIKAFYYLLDNKRKKYFFYTFILILVLLYDLVPTIIIGRIVDFFSHYSPDQSLNNFYFYTSLLAISWGLVSLVRLSIKKQLSIIRADVTYATKTKGFEKLLDFSLSWHDKENTGNKVEKIKIGAENLRQMQAILSNELFGQITGIVGVLIAFTILDIKFFYYGLSYLAIFIFIQLSFYKKMVEMNNENNILQEKAGGSYYEGLSNILTIKTMGVKDDFKKNIFSKESDTRDHSIKIITLVNNKWKFFQFINAVALGGILYMTGQSFIAGTISLGSIFIVYNYFQKLNGSISQSTDTVENLIRTKVGISRMMQIFGVTEKKNNTGQSFPSSWDKLKLINASFKYQRQDDSENKHESLKEINFEINKNEKIGVVGKSGGGKSTFAKILLGLYDIASGQYKIGDSDFYNVNHDEITKNVALVLQDSEMFNLSLKENITLLRPFDENLFEKATSIAQLNSVIEKLPNGVETLIGEKGYRLSGGERQRIGLARAIYKNPQILILDEATSSLDSNTESLIQKAFEENLRDKTVISIAHRVSTLSNTDRIVVFDQGSIVEQGSFNDLSENKSSKFFEIYEKQKIEVGD